MGAEYVTVDGDPIDRDEDVSDGLWIPEVHDPRVTERWAGGAIQRRTPRRRKNASRVKKILSHDNVEYRWAKAQENRNKRQGVS